MSTFVASYLMCLDFVLRVLGFVAAVWTPVAIWYGVLFLLAAVCCKGRK